MALADRSRPTGAGRWKIADRPGQCLLLETMCEDLRHRVAVHEAKQRLALQKPILLLAQARSYLDRTAAVLSVPREH